MKIPKFNSTEHAWNFGLTFFENENVRQELLAQRQHYKNVFEKLLSLRDGQASLISYYHQVCGEALDALDGKVQAKYFYSLNKNVRRMISRGELIWH